MQRHFLPVWKVNAKLSSSSFCMVQPTNKSAIGSNLREDSIKKAGVWLTSGAGWTLRRRILPCRPSLVCPPECLCFYTISLPFPPPEPLHLLLSSALLYSESPLSTPLKRVTKLESGSRKRASAHVFKIKSEKRMTVDCRMSQPNKDVLFRSLWRQIWTLC